MLMVLGVTVYGHNLGKVMRREGLGNLADQLHERFMAFRKIGRLGRPVVHLGVDVDRVLASPRRAGEFIPQSLQIRRLPARATG